MKLQLLSIVIPTYNEKDNINELILQLNNSLKGIPYEIIFVDDSDDDTPKVILEKAEIYNNIKMEHRTVEKGLATAVIRGFELAQGKYVAVMDADLQHPPMILRSMYIAMCEGTDMCIPSRFIRGGSDGGLDIIRKFISGTARYIGKIMLPCLRNISDPTSGLFMFKKSIINERDLQPVGWKIMIEVLAMASYNTIIEIPYSFQNRNAGESKLSGKVTVQYIKQLFSLIKRAKDNDALVKRWSSDRMAAENDKFDRYLTRKGIL